MFRTLLYHLQGASILPKQYHLLTYEKKKIKNKIKINHQPDATIFQFIILTFIYSSTCFGRSFAHHQELSDCSSRLWFYLRIAVIALLCSWSGRITGPTTNTALLSPRWAGERPKHVEL